MDTVRLIELYANNLEKTLLITALENLLDKVSSEGDFYCVSPEIEALLTQLKEIN